MLEDIMQVFFIDKDFLLLVDHLKQIEGLP